MEWCILAGVVVVLIAGGAAVRLRLHKSRRAGRETETDSIYPLW
jgi:hypothetical protein